MRNHAIAWLFAFAFALTIGFAIPACRADEALSLGKLLGCPSKWIFPMVGGIILAEHVLRFLETRWPSPQAG